MIATSLIGIAIALTACDVRIESTSIQKVERPVYALATDEAYDLVAISLYGGQHAAAYEWIDSRLPEHLAAIRRWLRQPSVSAQNIGIRQMAEMVLQDLEDRGFDDGELIPADCHPGVWGDYDAGAGAGAVAGRDFAITEAHLAELAANCELRTANCELRTANCELRTANCELRSCYYQ